MNNYIKMNNNKYLSLGNIVNLIKEIAASAVSQIEIFCALFNVNDINNTTVNNYCIGYRAIGILYKNIYINLNDKMDSDYLCFTDIILSLIRILDNKVYTKDNECINLINNNINLKKLCAKLYLLAKKDEKVSKETLISINKLYNDNNLYECIIKCLSYAIIDNRQPLYIENRKVIINSKELEDYLQIKLYEGLSYITSLQELSKKNNMYACAELGSLEFDGLVSGFIDYNKCYEYYLKAADKNHPKSAWMVANLIITKRVSNDFSVAWNYLNKAIKLGSVAALNTMGNCYLNGDTINHEKDLNKAIKYYTRASEYGYVYAFNNLGKIYEKENYKKSLKYYQISADMKESWALNKVGEYYRLNDNLDKAYVYYLESSISPINEREYYSYYNLAKYYYLIGNKALNIKKSISKAKEYLQEASKHNIKEASFLLKEIIDINR